MCNREAFAKLQDAIVELQKADAAQSEQIRTLFATTEKQGRTIDTLTTRLVMAVIGVLLITVFTLVFCVAGERGYRTITGTFPDVAKEVVR